LHFGAPFGRAYCALATLQTVLGANWRLASGQQQAASGKRQTAKGKRQRQTVTGGRTCTLAPPETGHKGALSSSILLFAFWPPHQRKRPKSWRSLQTGRIQTDRYLPGGRQTAFSLASHWKLVGGIAAASLRPFLFDWPPGREELFVALSERRPSLLSAGP